MKLFIIRMRLSRWWYEHVTIRFSPRQKWLKIPRTWTDKDYLFESVIQQGLIHFCEKEGHGPDTNGLDVLRYQFESKDEDWYDDETREIMKARRAEAEETYLAIKAAYDFFKTNPDLDIMDEFVNPEQWKAKEHHMETVFRLRHYLWT